MASVMEETADISLVVGICDDNGADREKYREWIEQAADEYNIAVTFQYFESGEELLFWIEDRKNLIDILYLDIFMKSEDGISVAHKLRKKNSPVFYDGKIIFLTRSDRYTLEAFDVGAFHYIVKGKTDKQKFNEIFRNAAHHIKESRIKRLLLRGIGEYRWIAINKIHYFEVIHHIIIVHYEKPEKTFEFYSSMEKLENTVLPFGFLRIHRSYLVQMNQVERLSYSEIQLIDGTTLPIGRNYYKAAKQALDLLICNHTTISRNIE